MGLSENCIKELLCALIIDGYVNSCHLLTCRPCSQLISFTDLGAAFLPLRLKPGGIQNNCMQFGNRRGLGWLFFQSFLSCLTARSLTILYCSSCTMRTHS